VVLYGLFWITFSFGLELVAIELFGFPASRFPAKCLRGKLLSFMLHSVPRWRWHDSSGAPWTLWAASGMCFGKLFCRDVSWDLLK